MKLQNFGSGPSYPFFHSYTSAQFTEEFQEGAAPVLQIPAKSWHRRSLTNCDVSRLSLWVSLNWIREGTSPVNPELTAPYQFLLLKDWSRKQRKIQNMGKWKLEETPLSVGKYTISSQPWLKQWAQQCCTIFPKHFDKRAVSSLFSSFFFLFYF